MRFEPGVHRALLHAAAGPWPRIPPGVTGVDTNTADVFVLAIALEEHGVIYPRELPAKSVGVAIVNEVERFVGGELIRFLGREVIVSRGLELITRLRDAHLITAPPLTQLAVAFSTWHGCINMAKSLRTETSDGTRYTEAQRAREYEHMQREWTREAARGNSWVRYGVSLARTFEIERGNRLNDAHIPPDSPYWA